MHFVVERISPVMKHTPVSQGRNSPVTFKQPQQTFNMKSPRWNTRQQTPSQISKPLQFLDFGVLHAIRSLSRYKLLTILSAMRRRDPQETGLLSTIDVQDMLEISNLNFDMETFDALCSRYEVDQNAVDYRSLWKYVMGKEMFNIFPTI